MNTERVGDMHDEHVGGTHHPYLSRAKALVQHNTMLPYPFAIQPLKRLRHQLPMTEVPWPTITAENDVMLQGAIPFLDLRHIVLNDHAILINVFLITDHDPASPTEILWVCVSFVALDHGLGGCQVRKVVNASL